MCILLQLDCAKFGVSNLFLSKVIEKKPLGGLAPSPLGKGRVKKRSMMNDYFPKQKVDKVIAHVCVIRINFEKDFRLWVKRG